MTLGSPFMSPPSRREGRMRRSYVAVKSGDNPERGAFAELLVDDLLRVIEAAAALRFAIELCISRFGGAGVAPGDLAQLVLGDGVADAHDHGTVISIMRTIRNYYIYRPRSASPVMSRT